MSLLRTEAFVPLTPAPAAGARGEFRVTVIPQAASPAAAFQTLPAAGPAPGKAREPRVTIQREGDRVTGLRVQCACGQVLDLSFVYESDSKPA